MASVYFDTRSDITELENELPELAQKFKLLRDELDLASDSLDQNSLSDAQRTLQSQIARRYEASKEFDDTIMNIRSHKEFKNFLLGPSMDELKHFATLGPIVFLNVSRFGSDAFLITHDNIRHLPLSKLTYTDLKTNSEMMLEKLENDRLSTRSRTNASMGKILEWLWDVAVESILDELGFTDAPQNDDVWPQIWWIPVGRLSLFPIHAAGYHSISGRTALDRVISSYTPTVRALGHARAQMVQIKRESSLGTSQTILLTSMPTTPNRPPSSLRLKKFMPFNF